MTSRRGFLGKMIGAAALGATVKAEGNTLVAKMPPGIIVPIEPVAVVVPPTMEIKATTVDPDKAMVLLESSFASHRIQIEIDRAIQFRHGRAWVTEKDAKRLQRAFNGWGNSIWPATQPGEPKMLSGLPRTRTAR